MNPVSIGPFLFSMGLLALVAGAVGAQLSSGFYARRDRVDVGNGVYLLLLFALVAARIGFLVRWWPAYAAHPWDMLNVRDGGFDPWSGLVALVLAAAVVAWRRAAWRRPLLVSVAVGVAIWGLVLVGGSRLNAAAHPALPKVALQTLDGKVEQVAEWRGQPTVINFWATWCAPCRREMPVLAQAQEDMPGVRFVFADQAESPQRIRAFLAARGLGLDNVVIDDGALARYYNIRGYPTTLFIGSDGRLREIHVGELSHASLRASLQRMASGTIPVGR